MEKRAKPQASKSLSCVKKVQECVPRNKTQRHERYREPNSTNNGNNKATGAIQKQKSINYSRQRNVVQRKLVNLELDETDVGVGEDTELYSVYSQGSKKQNLNHLLNFHYTAREQPSANQSSSISSNTWPYNKKNKKSFNYYSKYDKNQFLQANCQFVVKSAPDYNKIIKAHDILEHWDSIEQINMMIQEDPQCPICLFPPIACKITKCGHYFCYPCLLHYIALSEKSWQKCPICSEAVTINDLKSVLIKSVKYHNVNDEICFDLVKKEPGSFITLTLTSNYDPNHPPCLSDPDIIYSKVLLATVADILNIIDRENNELTFEKVTNCESSIFIDQALEFLNGRKDKTLSYEFTEERPPPDMNDEADAKPPDFIYFYQAKDAHNIYLHPMNCKILKTVYEDFKECPSQIKGRILQKEQKLFDDVSFKRYSYLQHLPLGSNIELCEIEFLDPIVPDCVLDIFRDDIKKRESRRKRKEYQENIRCQKIDKINEKLMGFKIEDDVKLDINLESIEQFPDSIVAEEQTPSKSNKASTSFAKILTSPKDLWPTLPQKKLTTKIEPVSQPTSTRVLVDAESEEIIVGPAQSGADIGNAIFEAIQKGSAATSNNNNHNNNLQAKKKKGKKGTVLFATGLR